MVRSRIKSVHELCEAAANMQHKGTIGDLREFYIRNFLKDFMPPGVTVRSGIVCDCKGICSRQLDLVITLDTSLPVIGMRDDVSLIPYDSVLLYIEIKSCIDKQALKQVEKQRESIKRLFLATNPEPGSRFIFPGFLIGIDHNSLSKGGVHTWMKKNPDTNACCVIRKYFIRSNNSEHISVDSSTDTIKTFKETLSFLEFLYESVTYLKESRKYTPRVGSYLLQGFNEEDFVVDN